jgi:hypothetical protein
LRHVPDDGLDEAFGRGVDGDPPLPFANASGGLEVPQRQVVDQLRGERLCAIGRARARHHQPLGAAVDVGLEADEPVLDAAVNDRKGRRRRPSPGA